MRGGAAGSLRRAVARETRHERRLLSVMNLVF